MIVGRLGGHIVAEGVFCEGKVGKREGHGVNLLFFGLQAANATAAKRGKFFSISADEALDHARGSGAEPGDKQAYPGPARPRAARKGVGEGKSVSVGVDLGGSR